MKFQLFLDTTNEKLFRKAISELGTIFYHCLNPDKGTYEIAYFSGSRVAKFSGTPHKNLIELCEACGFEVARIDIDELTGMVKIRDSGSGE